MGHLAFCRACPCLFACNGECPKNRILLAPDGEPGLNWLCLGLRRFFAHTDGRMRLLAEIVGGGGEASTIMSRLAEESRSIGRNDRVSQPSSSVRGLALMRIPNHVVEG